MFPKLNPEPVLLCTEKCTLKINRDKIAAAYAGAWASKELQAMRLNPLLRPLIVPFKDKYLEVYPACVHAANTVGLSTTMDLLDYYNPGKASSQILKEALDHIDNPFYPFFEED